MNICMHAPVCMCVCPCTVVRACVCRSVGIGVCACTGVWEPEVDPGSSSVVLLLVFQRQGISRVHPLNDSPGSSGMSASSALKLRWHFTMSGLYSGLYVGAGALSSASVQ